MKTHTLDKFMMLILLITGILFGYSIYRLDVLSLKYIIPVFGGLFLIVLLLSRGMGSGKKKFRYSTRFITVVLTILLLSVSFMSLKGNSLISGLFNSKYEDHLISLVMLKENKDVNFENILNSRFSANINGDSKIIEKVTEVIFDKYEVKVDITYFEDYKQLINRFYAGLDDVFILPEAQRSIINELYPNFDLETIVVDTISFRVPTNEEEVEIDTKKDTFSLFVTGIDTFGPVSTVSRSDVNMIITVNPITNQILLTNLPRDTQVELASFGKLDKLTHAGIYGVNESVKTLENFLDIDIDYYLKVNFNSIIDIVDAMDGVDIDSQFRFENGDFIVEEGMNHLNGQQALIFARARYNLPDMDNDRILNHQALMTGIMNKILSPAMITNFNSIFQSIEGTFELSMPEDQFKILLKNQLDHQPKWNIVTNTIMGAEIWSETTYSMPGHKLYLVDTYPEDLVKAKSYFLQIYSNSIIQQ